MPNTLKIQIPIPFHENCNIIVANEQGRFWISARFNGDQLNHVLITEHRLRPKWAYFWTILMVSILGTSVAYSQTCPLPDRRTSTHQGGNNDFDQNGTIVVPLTIGETQIVEGVVRDKDTNKPIKGAHVFVSGTENGVTTDADGRFKLRVLFGKNTMRVTVDASGYTTNEFNIESAAHKFNFFLNNAGNRNDLTDPGIFPAQYKRLLLNSGRIGFADFSQ